MVSGRVAKSKKYGLGRSGSRNGRFHEGLNSEIDDFWDGRQIQETWSWKVWVSKGGFDKGANTEIDGFWKCCKVYEIMIVEGLDKKRSI